MMPKKKKKKSQQEVRAFYTYRLCNKVHSIKCDSAFFLLLEKTKTKKGEEGESARLLLEFFTETLLHT